MADVERITPPVPTLPPPIGRGVGSQKRRPPGSQRPAQPDPQPNRSPEKPLDNPSTDHIDEYV